MSPSIQQVQLRGEKALSEAGVDSVRSDVRLLLCHALGCELQTLIAYPERILSEYEQSTFEQLLMRRVAREPISHILGVREFWSLPFKVTADTLTPRPDSETLIEAVLQHIPDMDQNLRIADLGVGTGCLLLAVLSEYPNATGLAIDQSEAALGVARENAHNLGLMGRVQFMVNDWLTGLDQTFDVILCNPPYIALEDQGQLEAEVARFEPQSALFAGQDGLDDYRRLGDQFARHLPEGGKVFLEIGIHQGDAVAALMNDARLQVLERKKDLSGIERCLILQK